MFSHIKILISLETDKIKINQINTSTNKPDQSVKLIKQEIMKNIKMEIKVNP